MSAGEPRWYVVQTHPRSENRALTNLIRQGFTTYLPRYQKRRKHARRVDIVCAPLFPRYLFVQLNLDTQRWRPICSTVGVARVIANGDMPTAVPQYVIEQLHAREGMNGLIQLEPTTRFNSGDKVRILTGPFADCLGLFEYARDSDRVAVLLDLLGRKVRATVGFECVEAA